MWEGVVWSAWGKAREGASWRGYGAPAEGEGTGAGKGRRLEGSRARGRDGCAGVTRVSRVCALRTLQSAVQQQGAAETHRPTYQ